MYAVFYVISHSDCTTSQPEVFIQKKPALARFNREVSRIEKDPTDCSVISLFQYQVEGTPRGTAACILDLGSLISNGNRFKQNHGDIPFPKVEVKNLCHHVFQNKTIEPLKLDILV